MFDDIFETVNSGFAQSLYEDFLEDPDSVPPEWRKLFENGLTGSKPASGTQPKPQAQESPEGAAAPSKGTEIKGPPLMLLRNMEASLSIPTATSFRDLEVTDLWRQRRSLNRQLQNRGKKLSFTHLIGWALVQAVKQFPMMVHSVSESDGNPLRQDPGTINLGLAVDVERKDGSRGLLVPVLRAAEKMTFDQFVAEYDRLIEGARGGKLMPDAYQGAGITLTNPGTIGTTASVPRLMTGQGSIIATGAIRSLGDTKIMTASSTYDHRIIQGAESGEFLKTVDLLLRGEEGFYDDIYDRLGLSQTGPAEEERSAATPAAVVSGEQDGVEIRSVVAALAVVRAHRLHGHRAARLDPLDSPPRGDPALDPDRLGLTPTVMQKIPAELLRIYAPGETLAEALPKLQEIYCGSIAYEIEHINDHEERLWLRKTIESGSHRKELTSEERRWLFSLLVRVDVLEQFLHKTYLGNKRFGVEGLDLMVPMIAEAINRSEEGGCREVVIGMAHRGRLNVLAHILGRPYETLLAEFEGGRRVEETLTPKGGTGDVKYHHGAAGEFTTEQGYKVEVNLMSNPSHLEAVNPVVEGRARAQQTKREPPTGEHEKCCVLPVLLHGDAAFAAQGVVAETFNLERLRGYSTGGTIHLITNNQVGFTTNPDESRSTEYASDLAKGFDVPIIHVNADDAEACIAAIRLAVMYRDRFAGDCVIDLVGYRRHGHNEGDEPRYTQPKMYQAIDQHPPVRELYARELIELGLLTEEEVEQEFSERYEELVETQKRLKEEISEEDQGEEPQRISARWIQVPEPDTRVSSENLVKLNDSLLRYPEGFNPHRKLVRQLEKRKNIETPDSTIDWAHAEALAIGTLLNEGVPIRLTGQDTVRGTFSQRHLTLHDTDTGKEYCPLQNLPEAEASFELYNSPLSEYAALGFEYGYSVAAPETLVVWEAQFGDFANNAEVIIDQFIIAGLAKWGQTSRLTLLLPHGYEGQGPEHSSARLERYLALGVQGNIRVANCSTPGQYFHLLRRQALIEELRPLVVMTPKSLLRHPSVISKLDDLTHRQFQPVLDDPALPGDRSRVTRLVLCSGKVYYDVVGSEERESKDTVAIGRIELLYPFPTVEVDDLLSGYPNLKEVVWLQEEPYNMGARKWIEPQLEAIVADGVAVRSVTRPESPSPAEGYPVAHQRAQSALVEAVLE